MSKKDEQKEKNEQTISEQEVKQVLEKVREIQEANQKYLITPSSPRSEELPPIINMANTNT